MITKRGYIGIFSHTYRFDWFISQIAWTALKYVSGVCVYALFFKLTVSLVLFFFGGGGGGFKALLDASASCHSYVKIWFAFNLV